MNFIRKNIPALAAVALAAVLAIGSSQIQPSSAYFTTFVRARGYCTIEMDDHTRIKEDVEDLTKKLTVTNEDKYPCFIRIKPLAGERIRLTCKGTNWNYNAADGYWYYALALNPGASASLFTIDIDPGFKTTDNPNVKYDFNVVVVQESTAALYDANGRPYADWTKEAKQG